ncbi:geranylgeranylglyceryl/heptaprenylglyceryl phosphate synthase [Pseudothermotoga thermarum]|uniref:Dihydroorotate oxidase B, catalytic subunit n=1 Tax=Pseudothermotoga thermarum DSM 5069 TaxID=688269 RepID=F7YWH3_9THEM|nr:geranylgeranylglyceryl/heptaprenylglyceryl phosphate synthase [Pseudothermotoga thermarum]AEH51952.1 dihydroorotate oxidase B, catalytic subunit [Pseudothermotoga thermarum DSM 5069]
MDLKVPLVIASGVGGMGEYLKLVDPSCIGAYTLKTITLKSKVGNPPCRLIATKDYLINSIGLENPGVDEFLRRLKDGEYNWIFEKVKVILSLGGDNLDEYRLVAEKVKDVEEKFVAIEFNFSCPNVEKGGLGVVTDLSNLERLLGILRKTLKSFLIAKVGIEGIFVEYFAKMLENNGWNGISLINTIRALKFVDGKIFKGGLSGPVLKPIALRAVYEVRRVTSNLFVIGGGGISNEEDAKEFLMAGADAVSVGTIIYKNPKIVERIAESLRRGRL